MVSVSYYISSPSRSETSSVETKSSSLLGGLLILIGRVEEVTNSGTLVSSVTVVGSDVAVSRAAASVEGVSGTEVSLDDVGWKAEQSTSSSVELLQCLALMWSTCLLTVLPSDKAIT